MCDYSLTAYKSRPARVGEKLVTHRFPSGSTGFIGSDDYSQIPSGTHTETAVCVLPGTEIAFEQEVLFPYTRERIGRTARFRQINADRPYVHHDALEFPDSWVVELNRLESGIVAVVLQLPAAPKTAEEAKAQSRLEVVG